MSLALQEVQKTLKLISFDACGLRCIAQVEMLEEIMYRIQQDLGKTLLPCEWFDCMGGTGTGGLIIAMLVALRMSVQEVREKMSEICLRVYPQESISQEERSLRLRKSLEDLFMEHKLPINTQMNGSTRKGECTGFVIARPVESHTKAIFRTYPIRSERPSSVTLVDAIIATCAQLEFAPVTIGTGLEEESYVGWGMGMSNPIRQLILEATQLHGENALVGSLISLGSSKLGEISVVSDATTSHEKILFDVLMNPNECAQEMERQLGKFSYYCRLSADLNAGTEHKTPEQIMRLSLSSAKIYLRQLDIDRKLNRCLESLNHTERKLTLGEIGSIRPNNTTFKSPPALTPYFVMRKEPWDRIVRGLIPESGDGVCKEQMITVISGITGCGKSQLAVHAMIEHGSRFKFSFFIDGSSEENIKADILQIVQSISPAHSEATFEEALSFFSNGNNRHWLLVYDGVDDVECNLAGLIPNCNFGAVIVTTTNRSLGLYAFPLESHIELGPMSDTEAIDTLIGVAKIKGQIRTESFAKLAAELGHLPIALVQAGSYMFQTRCSCEEYRSILQDNSRILEIPAGDRQHRSAYAAFDLSYKRLPHDARKFLRILGNLHHADFPMAMLSVAVTCDFEVESLKFPISPQDPNHASKVKEFLEGAFCPSGMWRGDYIGQLVQALYNYSLASFRESSNSLLLQLHPLVHRWVSNYGSLEDPSLIRSAASRLVSCVCEKRELLVHLLPHIDRLLATTTADTDDVNERATLACALRRMGRLGRARDVWENILRQVIDIRGKASTEAARARLELALTYREDLEKKGDLQKEAISILQKRLGPNHLETLKARSDLGLTYHQYKRYKESVLEQEDAYKRMCKHHGPKHLDTVNIMRRLAFTYVALGLFKKAVKLQVIVLEQRRQQLGKEDRDTLVAVSNLADTYSYLKRLSDAESLSRPVLDIYRQRMGNNHPDTFRAMDRLARVYKLQRRYQQALDLQKAVCDGWKVHLGEGHPTTLAAIGRMIYIYKQLGQYSEAAQYEEIRVKHQSIQSGRDYSATLKSMYYLAETYFVLRNWERAESLASELISIQEPTEGADNYHYQKAVDLKKDIEQAKSQEETLSQATRW